MTHFIYKLQKKEMRKACRNTKGVNAVGISGQVGSNIHSLIVNAYLLAIFQPIILISSLLLLGGQKDKNIPSIANQVRHTLQ